MIFPQALVGEDVVDNRAGLGAAADDRGHYERALGGDFGLCPLYGSVGGRGVVSRIEDVDEGIGVQAGAGRQRAGHLVGLGEDAEDGQVVRDRGEVALPDGPVLYLLDADIGKPLPAAVEVGVEAEPGGVLAGVVVQWQADGENRILLGLKLNVFAEGGQAGGQGGNLDHAPADAGGDVDRVAIVGASVRSAVSATEHGREEEDDDDGCGQERNSSSDNDGGRVPFRAPLD